MVDGVVLRAMCACEHLCKLQSSTEVWKDHREQL